MRHLPRWLRVRSAWAHGQAQPRLPAEPADATLLEEGRRLQADAVSRARGQYGGYDSRVFLVRPPTISGQLWFDGLASALTHMGVRAVVVGEDEGDWEPRWRALEPTVLIAPDRLAVHARLGPEPRAQLARRRGLRLLVPMAPAGFPHDASRNADDERSLRMALTGESADAFLSIYEPEYFARYAEPLSRAGFAYLALPQACDPFQDVPHEASKEHAWFMASTFTADRLAVASASLLPILRAAPGLWVGSGWHFGGPRVASTALPRLFASARIALAPLVPFLREQPLEITYRVFAAAACGAFQITHHTPVTDRFFTSDELIQARDDREFHALFAHYVSRPAERQAVARRALARAYRSHTTFARVDRLLAFVDGLRRRRSP